MNETVLVVIAHSDDETIGAGGSLARHLNQGDKVCVVSMTDGVGSRFELEEEANLRKESAEQASNKIGFTWLDCGSFPDNAMDTVPLIEVVRFIEKIKKDLYPDIIYTHSAADLNIDHQIVNRAVLTAFRPNYDQKFSEIRAMEIPSSTDYSHEKTTSTFTPNLFIDIEKTWEKKLEGLQCYDKEIRQAPDSRSYEGIENLAKLRGNQVGLCYAEAFEILKKIER